MRKLFLCMFVVIGFFSSSFAKATDILVIESYHQEYPWDASYIKGLNSTLASQHQIEFFQMDTKRRPKAEHQQRAEMAWDIYKQKKPKLVILGDDNALKYLGPKFAKTDTPVVYLGINNNPRDYFDNKAKNFTGVLERPLFKRSIATISNIITPPPKKILVLFDGSTTAKAAVREAFGGNVGINVFGVEAKMRLISDWVIWKTQVKWARKNGYDAIVIGLYHTMTDVHKKHVSASKAMEWTVKNSPVPLFSFWDFSVGKNKTAGGLVLSGEEQGIMAGNIAKKILRGMPPNRIYPQTAEKGRYLFSKNQLDNYNLRLPDNLNKHSTLID